jgi:hypothetical protein
MMLKLWQVQSTEAFSNFMQQFVLISYNSNMTLTVPVGCLKYRVFNSWFLHSTCFNSVLWPYSGGMYTLKAKTKLRITSKIFKTELIKLIIYNLCCSELSSGMYCLVKWLSTDVSEARTASIIRDDDSSQKTILNIILAAVRTWNLI